MAQPMPQPISRQQGNESRTAPAGKAVLKSILSEDVDWKPFAAFPPSARLAILVGRPTEPGLYTIRVKVPHGVKLMPHRHSEDRIYTVISGVFYIGRGDEFDADKLEAYPPGAVIIFAREYIALPLGEIQRVHHSGISDWAAGPGIRQFEGRSAELETQRVKTPHGHRRIESAPGDCMIIANIETFPLRIPFKPGNQAAASPWGDKDLPAADSLLVKVTTDRGLEGWGETFGFRAVSSAKLAIDELIAPLCIGRDATKIGPLMLEVQKKLHLFGRTSPILYGISAIDIALWDIAGKAAGVPVCRLLGGSNSDDLTCYASMIRYSDPSLVRANVRWVIQAGFHNLKLHEVELPVIRAAREEAGSGIDVMLDVNSPWTLIEARMRAQELQELRLKWLEEPVWPPENYDGLGQLRKACGIPIAAGENSSTLMDFERLLAAEAVDFVQPSVAKMGGITELVKVFPIAAVRNVTLMPHSFYDGPGLLATIHTTAALGTPDSMIEWRYFDLEAQVYGGKLAPVNGRISVPQRPGLGFDPDPNVVRDYLRVGADSRVQRVA